MKINEVITEAKFGVWATVSGGVTGAREAWANSLGERIAVDSYEEAQTIADNYNKMAMDRAGQTRYHYSVKRLIHESRRTEHKGYYDESGTYYDSKEAYDEHIDGKEPTDDTITANVEESKKKINESWEYARRDEEFFTQEEYAKAVEELKAIGGGLFPSKAVREKYKPFGKLGKLTTPEQVMQHQLAGIGKHEWGFHAQYSGFSEQECRICGRVIKVSPKGHTINR